MGIQQGAFPSWRGVLTQNSLIPSICFSISHFIPAFFFPVWWTGGQIFHAHSDQPIQSFKVYIIVFVEKKNMKLKCSI